MMLEVNKIYNLDCIIGLKKMPNNSVDLVFLDPPFNLKKEYGKDINDEMSEMGYFIWQKNILTECYRILKNTGAIIYYTIPKWSYKIANFLDMDLGMTFQNWICWSNAGSIPAPNRLYPKHYSVLWFTKTKKKIYNKQYTKVERCGKCNTTVKDYGGKYNELKEVDGEKVVILSDVWDDIHRIRHNKNKHRKANELPEKLMERIINLFSNPENLIVDVFSGTGTTSLVAKKMGRRFIGFELDKDSYQLSENRLK